uniref:WIF domain-containing protein n=1 Tax=Anopheles farauti TaxID=69004 RepID=A0A182PZI0_9DIPT
MWVLLVSVLLIVAVVPVQGIMVYGRCPYLKAIGIEPYLVNLFEGNNGEILYFSNVRFEALFDKRLHIEEHYVSQLVIVLEQKDGCFKPFQLQHFAVPIVSNYGMNNRSAVTTINTTILALHEKNYLLAFSCAQIDHNKLEFVWIFGRAGRFRVGLDKVQQMFGHLFANMSTNVQDLRRTHHEVPFCRSIILSVVIYGVGGVISLLAITAGIVCWKKHKQILQLRRQSCAECEYPAEEQDMDTSMRRDITSAKTIAVMNGTYM